MNPDDVYRAPKIRTDSAQSVQESLEQLSQWWDCLINHEFNNTRTRVGPVLDDYRTSKSAAKHALQSHDPLLRWGALDVLMYHWEKDVEITRICERLAMDDPDIRVKHLAILYISDYFRASCDNRISKVLAKIVGSEIEHNEIRAAAYRGLLLISTSDASKIKSIMQLRFPSDVNWEFVRKHESEQ